MWILKSYNSPIPGNYYYVQSEGIYHVFAANPIIEEVAKAVSSFRTANKLRRPSLGESLEDVDKFNCAVRANNPLYCRECAEPFEASHANHRFIKQGCPGGCGHVITQD